VLARELTVKALLTDAALKRFEPGAYRFCPEPSCDVVYFDARGRTFTTADLRVPHLAEAAGGRAHALLLLRRE
jgi:hypothetical protein